MDIGAVRYDVVARLNPFLIQGPAYIGFSGGRTSGYMLRRHLLAHQMSLPSDVLTIFNNTGDEDQTTLDFVKEAGERWGVDVIWLEYQEHEDPKQRWKRVTYETASRDGEPYDAMLARKGHYLPNPRQRFCTQELKLKPTHNFLRSLGWDEWFSYVGYRADEKHRLPKLSIVHKETPEETKVAPLARAGVGVREVAAFWKANDFDLRAPNINGKNPWGNCRDCFLKGAKQLVSMYKTGYKPVRFIAREAGGARFRNDRPSYADLYAIAQSNVEIDFSEDQTINDCECTDLIDEAA